MDKYQTVVTDLLADLIHEQQKTREAIATLAEALAGVRKDVEEKAAPAKPAPKKVAKAEQPKAEPEQAPEPEQPDGPTPDDLRQQMQDICMGIMRKDRSKKGVVKETIASYGNAKTLHDVPDADLTALKTQLEAL